MTNRNHVGISKRFGPKKGYIIRRGGGSIRRISRTYHTIRLFRPRFPIVVPVADPRTRSDGVVVMLSSNGRVTLTEPDQPK